MKMNTVSKFLKNVVKVIATLDNVTFRAIGFTDPLSISIHKAMPDFPTRVDWNNFFHDNRTKLDEREPGERPDTIYMSGLPFDWFQVWKNPKIALNASKPQKIR
jgi:hypothetical protein